MIQRPRRLAVILLFVVMAQPCWGEQLYLYTPKEIVPEEKGVAKDGVLVQDVPVQKGDTLFRLSRKFSGHGMYFPQILLFNNIKNPNLILAGDTLKVPLGKDVVTEEAAEPTTGKATKTRKHNKHEARKRRTAAGKQAVRTEAPAVATDIAIRELKVAEQETPVKTVRNKREGAAVARRGKVEQPAVIAPQPSASAGPSIAPTTQPVPTGATAPREQRQTAETVDGQKLFEQAVKAYRQDDYRTALELFDRYLTNNASSPLAADASLYKAECYLKLSTQ